MSGQGPTGEDIAQTVKGVTPSFQEVPVQDKSLGGVGNGVGFDAPSEGLMDGANVFIAVFGQAVGMGQMHSLRSLAKQ